jgi:hypothetical protein
MFVMENLLDPHFEQAGNPEGQGEGRIVLAGLDQAYKVLAIGILVIVSVALDQWIRKVRA